MKPAAEMKILVVEDDPFFQRILLKRLASEGYQVAAATDGREGMRAIVTFEPDLVVSDWMMPEVDGLELCQSVKTGLREAAPYFILLTAKGEISDKLLGLQTGADDYIIKPCDQGELSARVRAGLRIVELTQRLRGLVADLQMVNAELDASRGLGTSRPPICHSCHKVRDEVGNWLDLGVYLASTPPMDPSDELCPDCRDGRSAGLLADDGTEPEPR